jgi:hypothetical protein
MMAYVYVSTLIDDNVLRINKTKEEESVLGRGVYQASCFKIVPHRLFKEASEEM